MSADWLSAHPRDIPANKPFVHWQGIAHKALHYKGSFAVCRMGEAVGRVSEA